MKTAVLIAIGLILTVATDSQKASKTDGERDSLIITAFTSTANTIGVCPFSRLMCDPNDKQVLLTTDVLNPKKRKLTYSYTVTAGVIVGQGAVVTWDLRKALIGEHTAKVSVRDSKGTSANANVTVRLVECTVCDPPPPPCPTVTVECPSEVEKGKPISFTANIKGDPVLDPLFDDASYEWWASSGKIVRGQSEKKMTLEPAGFPFETITVTVSVGGFDPSCTGTQASCTISIKSGP